MTLATGRIGEMKKGMWVLALASDLRI